MKFTISYNINDAHVTSLSTTNGIWDFMFAWIDTDAQHITLIDLKVGVENVVISLFDS